MRGSILSTRQTASSCLKKKLLILCCGALRCWVAKNEVKTMKWIIIPVFWLLYWLMCFLGTGTDKKNLVSLSSYPDSVQKIVRERMENVPNNKSVLSILVGNLIFFTLIFVLIGLALKKILAFDSFLSAFLYFLILGEGLGLFDLLVIDLMWWQNTERIRFSFLPEKSYYLDMEKHIISFVRGIPLFTLVALLSARLLMLL